MADNYGPWLDRVRAAASLGYKLGQQHPDLEEQAVADAVLDEVLFFHRGAPKAVDTLSLEPVAAE